MNWGKGITLAIVLFMAFIASFVFRAFNNDSTEMVRDDYYEHETEFDQRKKNRANYESLDGEVTVVQKEEGIVFQFPEKNGLVKDGIIKFYRPDAQKYDRQFDLSLNAEGQQVLDYENFREGYYDIQVEWRNAGKSYLFEDNIRF